VAIGITLLRDLPKYQGYHFNPQKLIKAVNYFQSLGIAKSVRILQLYREECQPVDPLEPRSLIRLLFVFKEKPLPPYLSDITIPTQRFPLTPFHIHQGIPFFLIEGGFLLGEHLSLAHIEAQVSDYEVRETPLVPDNNPLASVDELLESALMREEIERDPWKVNMLRLQALYAVSSVYQISELERQKWLSSMYRLSDLERLKFFSASSTTDNLTWQKHREGFGELTVVWNQIANDYELR
jgi:hypothetical protein